MANPPFAIDFALRRSGVQVRAATHVCDESLIAADKPALIFLHFFGGSWRAWQPVMDELDGQFPCVALDLRGFGRTVVSEAPEEMSSYSLDRMAGDVIETITQLGDGRCVLVGHSMGGKVALAIAAGYGCPPGLEALVLVAPSPPTPEPMPDEERSRLLAGVGSEAAARETLTKITARSLPPDLAEMVVEDQLCAVLAAWRAWLERGSKVDISARIERIKVPVHLLAGEKDANITARPVAARDRGPPAAGVRPRT